MDVPRETQVCLTRYAAALVRWNRAINLVSRGTVAELPTRHLADSLQLIELRPEPGAVWLDLGSGGGLPAIPVACTLRGRATRVLMMESDLRKATFLRRVAADLDLDCEVVSCRIEAAPPCGAATVSARALAPLPKLMSYVARHMSVDGTALLPKGARWEDEVGAARAAWSFDLQVHPSRTEAGSVILEIRNLGAK